MSPFGQLDDKAYDAEPYRTFCRNLSRYIDKIDCAQPESREWLVGFRNLVFAHFVAARRMMQTAMQDDPALSDFRQRSAALSTAEHLQILGSMHAHTAHRCHSNSPQVLALLLDCLGDCYEMPVCITAQWDINQTTAEIARLRAQHIAQILGRKRDATRLAPILNSMDRKIVIYAAFLIQEPELVVSTESAVKSCESSYLP